MIGKILSVQCGSNVSSMWHYDNIYSVESCIVCRYFSMQAMDPLEFGDDNIRVEVEGRICTIEGRPRKDAFERPKRLALTTLQQVA